jgi:hypothetical protein
MNNSELNSSRCIFQKSRTGDIVPALCLPQGIQPLHSMIDPYREALRLISTIEKDTGFLIFLGLGGGFLPETALEQTDAFITVIDFDKEMIAELYDNKDYSKLLSDSRFNILIDPSYEEIKSFILDHYKPAIHGGIKTIPLRTRVEIDKTNFNCAAEAIRESLDIVTTDYTVQAHFGKRWFSNIIRNIKQISNNEVLITKIREQFEKNYEAAIVAAGPSLDLQIPALTELKNRGVFIISSDTALPALLFNGILPDIIVSIDCQHISYYHFLSAMLNVNKAGDIPLFLDIASPPLLSRIKGFLPVYFSGGHPLTRYISDIDTSLPVLDTSGGNVTYVCLSLAEYLNVNRLTIFGADFSYINSQSYAKGTYIYPYFYKRQNRLSTLETLFSKFLYRSPFLQKTDSTNQYFETASLRLYREKLEEKIAVMDAEIIIAQGLGAPIKIKREERSVKPSVWNKEKRSKTTGVEFLEQYKDAIGDLPPVGEKENYIKKLDDKQLQIFITLLPYAAAVKRHNPELGYRELIKEVKQRCIKEIKQVLSN